MVKCIIYAEQDIADYTMRKPSTRSTAPGGKLPPGAQVAAVYQPLHEHLEVFVIDSNGVLNTVWKEYNGNWHNPLPLTGANFATPGAAVAAVYYPNFEQLEVFVVDIRGALNVVWKAHDGNWNPPVVLTRDGFAPPGAPLAAVYQPINEQLEVFVVDSSGALNVVWKANNHTWSSPPLALTLGGFTKPGASVATAYYPTYQQLEVFTIDINGVFSVISKAHNGAWFTPIGVTGANFAPWAYPWPLSTSPSTNNWRCSCSMGTGPCKSFGRRTTMLGARWPSPMPPW